MADYKMTIDIDQQLVDKLRDMKMKLCCAFEYQAEKGESKYNVVAYAKDVFPINPVRWKDKYWMTASQEGFTPPYPIDHNIIPLSIRPGQTLHLNADWKARVQQDPHALEEDSNAMIFDTAISAAGILCKEIMEEQRTVHIISIGKNPMIPGRYQIVPTGSVKVFFGYQAVGTAYQEDVLDQTGTTLSYSGFLNPEVHFISTDKYIVNLKGPVIQACCFAQSAEDSAILSFFAVVNNRLDLAVPIQLKGNTAT